MTLEELFVQKRTENGDVSFTTTMNKMLDILFMSEYYRNHINEVEIGTSNLDKLFAMFMRDPRYGMGARNLGRELMWQSECEIEDVVKAGRMDDIFYKVEELDENSFMLLSSFIYTLIENGNELAKKWMPRYRSKNHELARRFAKTFGMNKQEYGKFIKANTTEEALSTHKGSTINFEHVPSLAMLKYHSAFSNNKETRIPFAKFLKKVKEGKADIKVTTTTPYDIYKNRGKIDPDLYFDRIEKIGINCLPIIDTSGSMCDFNDSFGKALSIGHYLSKCSTYAPNKAVSFSSRPQLLDLGREPYRKYEMYGLDELNGNSKYMSEIRNMFTGDCSNTDFGAVMDLLQDLDDVPEYLVVLSDMEFDAGSNQSKKELMELWEERGYKTKIVWWNFNSRAKTVPEIDKYGNIYMSGYNPNLLKYLQCGFDGKKFLEKLLTEYSKKIA